MAERVLACRKVSHGLQLQSLWRTRAAAVGSHGRVLACRTAWPTAATSLWRTPAAAVCSHTSRWPAGRRPPPRKSPAGMPVIDWHRLCSHCGCTLPLPCVPTAAAAKAKAPPLPCVPQNAGRTRWPSAPCEAPTAQPRRPCTRPSRAYCRDVHKSCVHGRLFVLVYTGLVYTGLAGH